MRAPLIRAAHLVATLALLAGVTSPLPAQAPPDPAAADTGALSPRNANYTIDARLDHENRLITGRQVLEWRNLQEAPTDELCFHLYWNGFRNDQSTWLREDRLRGRSDIDTPDDEDWGYLEVASAHLVSDDVLGDRDDTGEAPEDLAVDRVELGGPEELPLRFASPDDGNPEDRTVLVADLPRSVGPGETVRVKLDWTAKVPRTFARTGYSGDYYFIAHWFPKVAVFEAEGWNCHQFHSATEFYSDYGVYDVSLTLPDRFIVGATGRETDRRENGDGTTTHRYVEEDVHGFTWTASPDYQERTERFEVAGLPPVDMRLLYQEEKEHQADRLFDATRAALEYFGQWYGPYPYGHVTIIDPAWSSGAGGMEYPTIFTAGSRISRPVGGGSPEGVTIHEAGHQFWYGIVGNNEFEHAWIDEGLNTFSTARTYQAAYGERIFSTGYLQPPGARLGAFWSVLFEDVKLSRGVHGNRWSRYHTSTAPDADPQSVPTYLYYPGTAARISYDKTALWLTTLERYLGWETLQEILQTFFERYQFAHPRPEDFFAVANEVAGRDLDWYFDQVHRRAVTFDYSVAHVMSRPIGVEGFVEGEDGLVIADDTEQNKDTEEDKDAESSDDETTYRSEVVLRRFGEGVFPVEVLLVFEDGTEIRRTWEGNAHWTVVTEDSPSKLAYAAVDPDRILLLDLDYSNNSRRLKPDASFAARKWASKWMVWVQDMLQTFTFFI